MSDFIFKHTLEYSDACTMETIKKGETIYFLAENGELEVSDVSYHESACVIAFFAYELGMRKMYEFMNKLNARDK